MCPDSAQDPMTNQRRAAPWIALACLLLVSSGLFLQNLGAAYITLWDEAIHVNVIRNMAEHCCLPRLHPSADLGIKYQDWTNNTVWLHKPLLPFFVTTASYKLLGGSLWAFRLPGAIFALLTAVVIFLIGRAFLGGLAGLFGAAIFALNPYTNQLVHGTEYSGFVDLMFAFFASVALYLILAWTQSRSPAALRWLGLVLAFGYMCKGGLALAPFAVLGVIIFLTRSIRDFIPALQAVLVFGVLVLPEKLYWLAHHSAEFRFEQRMQLLHLFRVVEGHGGSWLSYFAGYLPSMLEFPLVPFAYFSIGWALVRCKPGAPGFTLSIWTLVYLVPLSLAASKIENFVFAVLPAIALLVPHAMETLMRSRRFRWVLSLCISSAGIYILSRATQGYEHQNRLALFAAAAIGVAALAMLYWMRFDSGAVTVSVLALASVCLLSLYVRRDIVANTAGPFDGSAQAAVRQAGLDLRPLVPKDSLILAHDNTVVLAYLYVMYWSGVDALDVCREPWPARSVARLRERKNMYLITKSRLPAVPLGRLAMGDLYSLTGIPFEVWSPIAAGACQSLPAQERKLLRQTRSFYGPESAR